MNMIVVGLIVGLVVLAIVVGWLARRATRLRQPWLRLWVPVLASLVAIALVGAAFAFGSGLYRLRARGDHPIPDVSVKGTPEELDRGRHLAHLCASCHSGSHELPLDGGKSNFLEGLGTIYPPNLTPGGVLADRSDGRILRAVREGVGVDGHPLLTMPSAYFHHMSDDDALAVVAYLKSQPEIDDDVPAREIGAMGTLLIGIGALPLAIQTPIEDKIKAPDTASPKKWGNYLVSISGCAECHGADFQGGKSKHAPNGPALTALADDWTAEEWRDTIRNGVDPADNELDPDDMPWQEYAAAYSDDELDAMQLYLRSLPGPGDAGK